MSKKDKKDNLNSYKYIGKKLKAKEKKQVSYSDGTMLSLMIKTLKVLSLEAKANLVANLSTDETKYMAQLLEPLVPVEAEMEYNTEEIMKKYPIEANTFSNEVQVEDKKQISVCPRCSSNLVKRKGAKGEFWGCSSFPKCRYTYNEKWGNK